MSPEISIRKRILLLLLLMQGLVTGALATGVVIYTRRQMLAAFDSELQRRMMTALAMAQTADEKPGGIEFNFRANVVPNEDLFAVWDTRGGLVGTSSRPIGDLRRIINAPPITFFHEGGVSYRGEFWHSIPLLDQESEEGSQPIPLVDVAYARPTETFHTEFVKVTAIAIAASCFWLTLSSMIAWFSVSMGLAPLKELAADASRITERSWTFRSSPAASSTAELRPLTNALQALVARLRSAFARERTFVSDAAHELKTAVAIQKSTLQVAANGPESIPDYRRGFEQALLDIDRLETLVSRMLSLASVEGSIAEDGFVSTALEETLAAACEQVAPLAKLRGVELRTENLLPSFVRGDAALLRSLWIALIENAIQHSSRGSSIYINLGASDSSLCGVSIRDCGEGIAEQDLPRVFDRFYRADRSRSRETGGYGLGLAIAKAIVERHNGSIHIQSSLKLGTTVQVQLPKLQPRIGS